ncbi:hypothetical protein BDV96DRAFT_654126 [Lophiotrema nucula]|uniref:DUF1772-domain-containing protein n=1 Tax=Lophiotrema nucula TaxID=690887 RepID=A0A6A5YJX1_9PLEO|nr:hypothetical protein BDV96DRAFT_654126 [Lophiotrema nucula]
MSSELTMDKLTLALQTYSILAVALAAGANLSTSIITLPVLLPSKPQALATQWRTLFNAGITPVVTLAMSSAAGFALLAYRATYTPTPTSPGQVNTLKRNLYVAAAIGAFSLAPYTAILMGNVNDTLMQRAAQAAKEEVKDTHELVRRWGTLNFNRGLLLLAGAACGVVASVL